MNCICSFLIVLTVGAVIFLGAVLLKATFDLADSFLVEQDAAGDGAGGDAGMGAGAAMGDPDMSGMRRLRGFSPT